jgi:hypothetical protein
VTVRRVLPIAAVALLTLGATAACGGGETPATAPTSATTGTTPSTTPSLTPAPTPGPGQPTDTTLQKPKARATISPTATLTAITGVRQLPAPKGAPRGLRSFPVPEGTTVKDQGAGDETWQFDIHTTDLAHVIAFYERVLPQMGYTVRTDVTYTLGYEKVRWDLAFDGPASGAMAKDSKNGVVFVGINPPGQKAFAGE